MSEMELQLNSDPDRPSFTFTEDDIEVPDDFGSLFPNTEAASEGASNQNDKNSSRSIASPTPAPPTLASPASGGRRKRKLGAFDSDDYLKWDEDLMSCSIPEHIEDVFVLAVFQLGLKHSSPKGLLAMLDPLPNITRAHLKSHLQKVRRQSTRTKEEFSELWQTVLKKEFLAFKEMQRWRGVKPTLHQAIRKQLVSYRKFEDFKKQLVKLTKTIVEVEDVMSTTPWAEGRMVGDICSAIVDTQGNWDGLLDIVKKDKPHGGTS